MAGSSEHHLHMTLENHLSSLFSSSPKGCLLSFPVPCLTEKNKIFILTLVTGCFLPSSSSSCLTVPPSQQQTRLLTAAHWRSWLCTRCSPPYSHCHAFSPSFLLCLGSCASQPHPLCPFWPWGAALKVLGGFDEKGEAIALALTVDGYFWWENKIWLHLGTS